MAKILIIDDEVKLREIIQELLSFSGYEVIAAENGLEALQKVFDYAPDLILCDVMMPILDGYGFMESHVASSYSHIPVIFITAKITDADQNRAYELGVKEYFKKPFIFKELLKSISNYINP
jgi:CheY-like chemotaxis protein